MYYLATPQRKGDILSNLMELDKRKAATVTGKQDSYRQYIKETAKLLDQMGQAQHLQVPGAPVDRPDTHRTDARTGDKKE